MTPSSATVPPIWQRRSALVGLLMLLGGLYWLFQAVQTPGLTCSRTADAWNCSLQNTLLGWLPLQQTEIGALQAARVGESCDRRGCGYRVELTHAGGSTPFSSAYTAERAPKDALVRQIENFLQNPGTPALAVWQTSGMMEMGSPLFVIAAGILMLSLPPRPARQTD